jgi:hypothetical protein
MPENQTKADIEDALRKLHVRTACTLVELTVHVLDLLDVQPPVVLEALIGETKRRHVTEPRSRQGLRQAYIEYCEEILKNARELRASNEELQSINEEYRSTSEELETSKEELQVSLFAGNPVI